jgi:N-acetyl-anhydromuramyl-L-alanine amidase AmpD
MINSKQFALAANEYYHEQHKKDLIVLHFTAGGSAAGAFSWWSRDRGATKVATAYIVDLDGTVYETFPPECWAFHMGTSSAALDRRTIGIEIVNWGPLRPDRTDSTRLNSWPRNWSNAYCRFDQRTHYIQQRWRGEQFWMTYPKVQMDAVQQLVTNTIHRFSIPAQLAPAARLNEFDPAFFTSFRGVAAHHNFRADKTDVGPAFNWAALGL